MRRGVLAIASAVLMVVLTTGSGTAPGGAQEPPPPEAEAPLLVGGTRNFLGTGTLLDAPGSPFPPEFVYLSVNPYCTAKVNGDRYQSGYDPAGTVSGTCTGTLNADHRASGYHYSVDVPDERTADIQVWLWDARYNGMSITQADGSTEASIDNYRQAGAEPFTFSLLAPDATPADDADNPILCSRTFTPTTPFEGEFLGSARWNQLPCPISPSDPPGRYLVRVQNGGTITSPLADGSNQFGIVAARTDHGSDPASVLCDSLVDPTCPRVAGSGGHSILAAAITNQVDLPLVHLGSEAQGRQLTIDLFDPGEGGNFIEVLRPSGPTSWTPATFSWSAAGRSSGRDVTRLPVTNQQFNGRLVRVVVDLDGYDPPPGNDAWKVRYNFSGTVTDRTTWDVAVRDILPSRITGLVEGPAPVEGSTVWLARFGDVWPGASSTVDADGRFGFEGVAFGTYQLYVAPPPGSPLVGRWIGGSGTDRAAATRWTVWGDGETIGTATTTLAVGASLSGTVSNGGAPLAGASVRVFGLGETWLPRATTTTADDGTWTVPGLPAGTYEVQVQPLTGAAMWAPGVASRDAGTPVVVAAGEAVTGISVDRAATRAVVGRVTDLGGTGVPDVRVVLYQPAAWLGTREATTRADGSFAILDVPDGTYQVRFLPPAGSGLASTWLGNGVRTASTTITLTGGVSVTGVDQTLPSPASTRPSAPPEPARRPKARRQRDRGSVRARAKRHEPELYVGQGSRPCDPPGQRCTRSEARTMLRPGGTRLLICEPTHRSPAMHGWVQYQARPGLM